MVEIRRSRLLFLLASICVCSSVGLALRISTSESALGVTHRREEKVLMKSSSTSDTVNHPSLIKNERLSYNMVQKRWLPGGFRSSGMKKRPKETEKRLIGSHLPRLNGQLSPQVMQDPLIASKKTKQQNQECRLTDFKAQRIHCTGRAKKPNWLKKASLEQRRIDDFSRLDAGITPFRNPHDMESQMDSFTILRPKQRSETFGNTKKFLPKNRQGRNQHYNSTRDSNIKPFEGFKLNRLSYPSSVFRRQSSTLEYTTSNRSYIGARSSEQPVSSERVPNSYSFTKNDDNLDGKLRNKDVAKSSNITKSNKIPVRGRSSSEYQLIPKIYATNLLRNETNNYKKHKSRDDWMAKSASNAIVGPSFKRKHTNAPVDNEEETSSRRTYVIHAEDEKAPFDAEYIQNAPVVRSQDKYMPSNFDGRDTASGAPIQLPYAMPGGVNISILVPNPPAAPYHETPLLTPVTSTVTYKNGKKKKDRKTKVNNDDNILLSEPRSFVPVSTCTFDNVYGPNVSNDDDNEKMSEAKYINKPQFNNVIGDGYYPVFNHMRNLSKNQLGWRIPSIGVQTESALKALADDDYDSDEIQMLYDEQSSSTELPSDQAQQFGPTISFSWYTMTKVPVVKAHEDWQTGHYRDPDQAMRGEFGSLERSHSRTVDDNCVQKLRNGDGKNVVDVQSYGTGEAIQGSEADHTKHNKFRMHHNGQQRDEPSRNPGSRDQWEALDEALKSEPCKKFDELWQAKNKKREVDSENNQGNNDEQSYYRLTARENSHENPRNVIMSVFRAKPNKHGQRDYYDNVPDGHIREDKQNRVTSVSVP